MGFDENKVRRGQPGNPGQFAPKRMGTITDTQKAKLMGQATAAATPEPPAVSEGPLPEIHLQSHAYTFGHWRPRDSHDPFDLNAPYQRGSVWTDDQRRDLIKSLYMGLPVGSIIVSHLPYRNHLGRDQPSYRIVDGKQRVETCRAWANDEFTVPRSWFRPGDVPDDAPDQVSWSDLTDTGRRGFDMSASVPAAEFKGDREWLGRDPETGEQRWRERTDTEILQAEAELFRLVNSGGTPQTGDDMERAARIAETGN